MAVNINRKSCVCVDVESVLRRPHSIATTTTTTTTTTAITNWSAQIFGTLRPLIFSQIFLTEGYNQRSIRLLFLKPRKAKKPVCSTDGSRNYAHILRCILNAAVAAVCWCVSCRHLRFKSTNDFGPFPFFQSKITTIIFYSTFLLR